MPRLWRRRVRGQMSDHIQTIIRLGDKLCRAVMVGNQAPIVPEMWARMNAPQLGDLVLETSTMRRQDPDRLGRLIRFEGERTSGYDCTYVIRTLDGRDQRDVRHPGDGRVKAIQVPCDACRADAGAGCTFSNGAPREEFHLVRVADARYRTRASSAAKRKLVRMNKARREMREKMMEAFGRR